MNSHSIAIQPDRIAAAIAASDALGLAGSSAMTNMLRAVSPVPNAVAAMLAADADFAERGAVLLAAHADIAFHADAISGESATSKENGRCLIGEIGGKLSIAIKAIVEALDDIRCQVATDRNLWDGVDPADIDIMSTRRLIVEHHAGRVPILIAAATLPPIFADAEGRN